MIDFQAVADCLAEIQTNGATSVKEMLLKRYGESVEGFKDVLKFIYDPYFTTGIKQAKLDNAPLTYVSEASVEDVMAYLQKFTTGSGADVEYALAFIYQSEDPNWQWAATGLVTKDLQIGVSVTTLNKVYGKAFIPKIGIMRGMLCPDDARGHFIVTEKIDGNRRLIMNKPTGVEIYTRSGKRDRGLVEIEEEVAKLPVGFVYDCECVATGSFGDNIELRQASASILNRRNQERKGVTALCFDVLPQIDYDNGISRMHALGRKALGAAIFGDTASVARLIDFATQMDEQSGNHMAMALHLMTDRYLGNVAPQHIKMLPILGIVEDKPQGTEIAKTIWDVGGEGVMLVDWASPYEVNPNPRKTLLKIKMLKEYTAMCVGVFEGDNKYTGTAGGIIVSYKATDGKTYLVKVGTGFTDWDRNYLWQHKDEVAGKMAELDSFGESVNAQGGRSLNCPVFKRFVGDTTNE